MAWLFAMLLGLLSGLAMAGEPASTSRGQTLYLPIYSHVWYGDKERHREPYKAMMSALVSIRSTDPVKPLRLLSARYYSTDGKLLAEYVPKPRVLPPLGTIEFLVEQREAKGGSGANFLIEWEADQPMNPPWAQAVHVSIQVQRSLSFITEAREVAVDR
ncbi:MAG: DUF3124 domain-containing protein [Betaproteobacteria bacterium]|nr:DUF3124 domain-containing protein [Betaproteobacteria bacterium]